MIEIALKEIEKYYGANKILENLSFEIQTGEKVGIIGQNGCGKTTIFKIISAIESFENGSRMIRKGAQIGYLDQIPSYKEDYKVIDVLKSAFSEVFILKESMEELESKMCDTGANNIDEIMNKYGRLQEKYEAMGGYEIEEKLNKVCAGLKLDNSFKERLFNTLSGGEKTTVVLGKILLQNPDILLLDEPTNHLDIESVEWLEEFFQSYKGTVLVISHDRYFMDKVVNKIVEIEDGAAEEYLGNYSYYVEEKDRRLTRQLEMYLAQQRKIESMEAAIKRLRDWANRGDNKFLYKRAFSMQRRLDKMDKINRPQMDRKKMNLDFEMNQRTGKDTVVIKDLFKAFDEKKVLNNINMHIRYGEKTALIGKNGCGKTTLIKILMGEYNYDSGELKLAANAKIGYLEQNVAYDNEDETVLDAFKKDFNMSDGEARNILAGFLFYGDDVFKKVSTLSGGEKSRLRLCILMQKDINVLILDEPTNHLDIDSREMLEESINDFAGTVIFISHDRYFINKVSSRVIELTGKGLTSFDGNYDYYKEKREVSKNEEHLPKVKVEKKKVEKKPAPVQVDKKNNEKQKMLIENEMEELEASIKEKDSQMELYAADFSKLNKLNTEKDELQKRLDELMEKWIEF